MRIVGSVVILAVGLCGPAWSQSPPPPPEPAPEPVAWRKHVVTLQPVPWPFGYYSGGFELALSEKLSLAIGANVTALTGLGGLSSSGGTFTSSSTSTVSVFGVHLEPGVSYYLIGRAPSGLWVGPKVEVGYVAVTVGSKATSTQGGQTTTNEFSTTLAGLAYGVHAMIGYTYAFDVGLTLQGGLGIGYASSTLTSSQTSGTTTTTSNQPFFAAGSFGRASLGVGWTF